jgi:rubrerythrin
MNPRTKKNLLSAMKSDAFESATYSRFAAHARADSDWDLAKVFQDSADGGGTVTFAREAALDGLVADSPENLRNALDEEMEEIKMYTQFAHEAETDGDLEAAEAFETIRREKANQYAKMQALLAEMGLHSHIKTIGA